MMAPEVIADPFGKNSTPPLRRKSTSDVKPISLHHALAWRQVWENRQPSLADGDLVSTADDDEEQPSDGGSDGDSDIDDEDDENSKRENSMIRKLKDDFGKFLNTVGDDGEINFNSSAGLDATRWSTMLNELGQLRRKCNGIGQKLAYLPGDDDGFKAYHKLLTAVLKAAPDLPAWVDSSSDNETTLHTALKAKNEALVRFFCSKAPGATRKALRLKTDYEQNGLHVAIQSQVSTELLEDLLSIADKETIDSRGSGNNTVLHKAVEFKNCREGQSRIVRKILGISIKSLEITNEKKLAPLQHLVQTRLEHEGQGKKMTPKRVNESDKIKSILMLECLRLMLGRKATMCLLYGEQVVKGPAISLDLRDYRTIRYKSLKDSVHFLNFEEFLQSVILPDLKVIVPDVQKEKLKGSKTLENIPPESSGRTDYWWIFHWLRSIRIRSDLQGVRRILKVSVEDNQEHPHSDETIERCLQGFGVEILDWKKPDICATTILSAAPEVRHLRMYCSGRNAVLRGWAAPGGLVELNKLQSLHVHIDSGFESAARVTAYAEQFVTDFKQNRDQCPKLAGRSDGQVEVVCNTFVSTGGGEDPMNSKTRGDGQGDTRQEWIECMERYRDFLKNLNGSEDQAVKVAIIDDGVDGFYAELSRYIGDGESWSTGPDGDSNPYYRSSAGHGTIMATFIRRLCPNVKFYVARLQEQRTATGKRSITAESAVNAINWAVSRGVDIISMSWTINNTNENAAWIDKMEAAIKLATAEKILIFCSVSDTGSLNDGPYPAKCDRGSIFVIGTATPSGKASEYNGDRKVDYIFPGMELAVSTGDDLFDTTLGDPVRDGSSLATALAAGLAGVILYSVKLNKASEVTMMKNHDKMNSAFTAINSSEKGESAQGFIRVWDLFDGIRHDKGSNQEKLKNIVDKLLATARRH